jgi:NADH:ubiquinone oxidoreductase subunit F (NADH-binding)
VSAATGVSEARVWGAGHFYSLLGSEPAGVRVCKGLSCRLAGSDEVCAELRDRGETHTGVSCLGQCDRAPVELTEDLGLVSHSGQVGHVSPDNPDLPINLGGTPDASFPAFAKAREMSREELLGELEVSGLQGRGGAAFPASIKWRSLCAQEEEERYVVCNADEGEPGTFKDRDVLLRRPDQLIQGLAIAAITVQARETIVYIRGEFRDEQARLERALEEYSEHIRDTPIRIVEGHGAYICGEETALLESMEGRRGMPRLKPPFPTEAGYRGRPTLVHNVETLACLPSIVERGGEWFHSQGRTEAGTKLYSVSGHVNHPGVYELPLGVTLDELVEAAGGYEGTPLAFSPGGASSGFLAMDHRDIPLDYGSMTRIGSMLGSAGVVVLNDTVDIAEAALWQAEFFEEESCGQCAPCRIGTRYVRQSLERYLEHGDPASLSQVEDVGWEMAEGSICGLGMVAAEPLQSARRHFPESFGRRPKRGRS